MKPITPSEARKRTHIPDVVIQAFNECIQRGLGTHTADVKQSEVAARILQLDPDMTRQQIFDNHWLDVEDVYREAGWKVEYDKPGYNEPGEAIFRFTLPTKARP